MSFKVCFPSAIAFGSLLVGIGLASPPALADAGHSHAAAIGEPGKASAVTRTIEVVLEDNAYTPETIRVQKGETVRFVLINRGELLHEFNIGTAAMHAEHQKDMAMMVEHGMLTHTGINHDVADMDHSKLSGMDMAQMKHDDPNSKLIEPSEQDELIWKFTADTTLEFACNMPGHYEVGMVGSISIVE